MSCPESGDQWHAAHGGDGESHEAEPLGVEAGARRRPAELLLEHVLHEALSFGITPNGMIATLEPVDFGVGVDVFFVISGYLITSILLRELREGSFSLLRFWRRRAHPHCRAK